MRACVCVCVCACVCMCVCVCVCVCVWQVVGKPWLSPTGGAGVLVYLELCTLCPV